MNPYRQCLYDPEWQALRVSLLHKWCRHPGVEDALKALFLYMSRSPADEMHTRAWRILNLLNATIMGYRGQKILTDDIRYIQVRAARERIRQYKRTYREQPLVVLDDRQVMAKWMEFPIEVRSLITADLSRRRFLHRYSEFRPELDWFLGTISLAETRARILSVLAHDVIKAMVMEGITLPGPKVLVSREYFDERDLPLWVTAAGTTFNLLVEFRHPEELDGSAYRLA